MINKHKSNKIKENSNTVRHWNNGTDHRHSKSCCDKSSPARRTISDDIWWHKTGSTLAQVMALCLLIASNHYRNQCWPLISEVLWTSYDRNFSVQATNLCNEFGNFTLRFTGHACLGPMSWTDKKSPAIYIIAPCQNRWPKIIWASSHYSGRLTSYLSSANLLP